MGRESEALRDWVCRAALWQAADEAGSPVYLALGHLESVDLALNLAIAPNMRKSPRPSITIGSSST